MKKGLCGALYWVVWALLIAIYWVFTGLVIVFMLPVRWLGRLIQKWVDWYLSKID